MSWIDNGEWDARRARTLIDLLADTYPSTAEMTAVVQDIGMRQGETPSDQLPPKLRWHELVRTMVDKGRLRALIDYVATDRPNLRTRLDELSRDDPGRNVGNPADAYQVRLIGPGRQPMINRRDLRRNVRQLLGQDRIVLAVRGPMKSGKSHSYRLMTHVVQHRDDFELQWINFAPPSSGESAVDLMSMICTRLGLKDITTRSRRTTTTKFARELIDEFVPVYKRALPTRITRVLVIDGLERFEQGSDVYDLAAGLAVEVAQAQLPRTQLVLIGYSGGFDPAIQYAVIPEDIQSISADDLHQYFAGLADDLGYELTTARARQMVKTVTAGNPSLAELSNRVRDLAITLIGDTHDGQRTA